MKQVVQNIGGGATSVREVPTPRAGSGLVTVGVLSSLVSVGTERYVIDLAQASLLEKARRRPDQVRRVLEKVRTEGLVSTIGQVRAKLDEPMALGYSAAGVVLESGREVDEFKPGDRVAVAAPHAGVVSVGRRLCARIPDGVPFESAAYAGVGAIALQGIRLARVQLGERVVVIGLGLIGLLTTALLKAQGCAVLGIDVNPARLAQAVSMGADVVLPGYDSTAVSAFTAGIGADAVIITASTTSNEPVEFSAEVSRSKGRIVLVGVAGLTLPRPPFFQKELEFTVSSSLGAGRGDAAYEEKGHDYPVGYARWTAQRNMQAVLDTIAAGRLPVELLTSHRFSIDDAEQAYSLVASNREPYTGIVLTYPLSEIAVSTQLRLRAPAVDPELRISVIGAGNFTRLVMLPALSATSGIRFRGLCTAKGLNAEHSGRKYDFSYACADAREVFADPDTDAVFITTRHNEHARLVLEALRAGKHVFVEKPLCIREDELAEIDAVLQDLGERAPLLQVGFNRRFASPIKAIRDHFLNLGPLSVSYRFSPGALPKEAWPHDPDVGGGRLIGEACHAIDTCIALIDATPVRVYAESVELRGTADSTDDRVFITMRHSDGSTSSVAYQAGGDRSGPSERIEVFGGGRTAILDEWSTLQLWKAGRSRRINARKDKGHAREIEGFIAALRTGGSWPIPWTHIRATTAVSMAAIESLRTAAPVDL